MIDKCSNWLLHSFRIVYFVLFSGKRQIKESLQRPQVKDGHKEGKVTYIW